MIHLNRTCGRNVERNLLSLLDELDDGAPDDVPNSQLIEDVAIRAGKVSYNQVIFKDVLNNLGGDYARY